MSRFRAVLAVAAVLAVLAWPGLFSELMGGFPGAGLLGLLLQAALVAIVGRLIFAWWRQRNAPAMAGGPPLHDAQIHPQSFLGGLFGGGGGQPPAPPAPPAPSVTITQADYEVFERLLHDVTMAYSTADLGRLGTLVTPEMITEMAKELADYASRGLVNETTDIKLLQGNLVDSWNEDNADFATVSLRYSVTDVVIDRKSGEIVEGSRTPEEASELWTFRRAPGGQWQLWAVEKPK
jgi:predicted lipid-binding transport protein (Tim44 family)